MCVCHTYNTGNKAWLLNALGLDHLEDIHQPSRLAAVNDSGNGAEHAAAAHRVTAQRRTILREMKGNAE